MSIYVMIALASCKMRIFFLLLDLETDACTIYNLYWHSAKTFIIITFKFYQDNTVFLVMLVGEQEEYLVLLNYSSFLASSRGSKQQACEVKFSFYKLKNKDIYYSDHVFQFLLALSDMLLLYGSG